VARPTGDFKSFSAPIERFEDTHVVTSWFSPWSWCGRVRPVPGGGVPTDVPILDIKLVFNEGGHDAFHQKFETIKERLEYARQLQRETGQEIPTGEDLPQYEAREPAAAATAASSSTGEPGNPSAAAAGGGVGASQRQPAQPAQPTPDEPPPDYEEAQAQAVGMRLEEQMREQAERS